MFPRFMEEFKKELNKIDKRLSKVIRRVDRPDFFSMQHKLQQNESFCDKNANCQSVPNPCIASLSLLAAASWSQLLRGLTYNRKQHFWDFSRMKICQNLAYIYNNSLKSLQCYFLHFNICHCRSLCRNFSNSCLKMTLSVDSTPGLQCRSLGISVFH